MDVRHVVVMLILATFGAGCETETRSGSPVEIVEYDFFGRAERAELGSDFSVGPRPLTWSPGSTRGEPPEGRPVFRVGPARLWLDDGQQLVVPEGTPGGNACELLYDPSSMDLREGEEVEAWPPSGVATPEECIVIGETRDDRVSWFEVLVNYDADSNAVELGSIVELVDGEAVLSTGYRFPLAEEVPVDCFNDRTLDGVVEDNVPHVAKVEVDSARVTAVDCIFFD